MNPYLIAVTVGAGFFGAKKLFDKVQDLRKQKLYGTITVAEFRKKREGLRKKYASNKEVIDLLDTIDGLCENLKDDDEITIG